MSREPTVQQLRCFRVLSEELHYGRAAQRLHMTQPPLTRHIQNLEASVGVLLFERRGRKIELTPAGASFLSDAEAILRRLDRGVMVARQLASGQAGELVIGYVEPLGINFLPQILGSFRDLHPQHSLRLVEMHTLDQLKALQEGTIDCGLLRAPARSTPELTLEPVWRDELVVALPERHVLARSSEHSVRMMQLVDQEFVIYDTTLGVGMLTAMLAACSEAGFNPSTPHVATSTPMLLALVAAGDGVAFVSGEIAQLSRPGVVFRRVADHTVSSEVLMGWRSAGAPDVLADLCHVIRVKGAQLS